MLGNRSWFNLWPLICLQGDVENENQDQPSPVSVLQPAFEEECSGSVKPKTTQG